MRTATWLNRLPKHQTNVKRASRLKLLNASFLLLTKPSALTLQNFYKYMLFVLFLVNQVGNR